MATRRTRRTRRNRRGGNIFTQGLRNKFGYEPLGSSTSALARQINSMLDARGIKETRLADFNDLMSVHKKVNLPKLYETLEKVYHVNKTQISGIMVALKP